MTLEISGIQYQCADDPSKSFSATLGNVTLDDDGVKVGPKEKHHFKIPSVGNKDAVRQLLLSWQRRATLAVQNPGSE